jgi:hypothetical protein
MSAERANDLTRRIRRTITMAGLIAKSDLKRERELNETKWFDYCFIDPTHATKLFAESYKQAYRAAWARHFDVAESEHRRGLFLVPTFLDPNPSKNARRTITGLWKARQFADELGVPYDFFCRVAFQFWLDNGPKRLPQPNQLFSVAWRERLAEAIKVAWREQDENTTIYPSSVHFQASAFQSTRAQRRHVERCLEVLKLKHGHPFQIARLVYERGFLSEAQVLSVFGEERIERARAEMVWREPVDVPTLSTYDFIPACAFVPHAHDSAAPECVGCHLREKCGAGQPGILERVIRQFGSDDPKQQRVRTQGALRVQRCRERKAQATRDAAA